MCEICGYGTCHPRCPNAEAKILGICAFCADELEAGYAIFKDDEGNLFCSVDCALEHYGIKETEM